jgi:hypothetical protein
MSGDRNPIVVIAAWAKPGAKTVLASDMPI